MEGRKEGRVPRKEETIARKEGRKDRKDIYERRRGTKEERVSKEGRIPRIRKMGKIG